jgi:excisionase family DNA binding protein
MAEDFGCLTISTSDRPASPSRAATAALKGGCRNNGSASGWCDALPTTDRQGAYGVKAQPTAPVPRVALTYDEAAAALGVSLSHFRRHVAPELRVVRSGAARLVPLSELQRWADHAATLAGARKAA